MDHSHDQTSVGTIILKNDQGDERATFLCQKLCCSYQSFADFLESTPQIAAHLWLILKEVILTIFSPEFFCFDGGLHSGSPVLPKVL